MTVRDGDHALAEDLLERMAAGHADFTLTFRQLSDATDPAGDGAVRTLFAYPAAYDAWACRWRERLALEGVTLGEHAAIMRSVNPAIIPRNHRVEEVIVSAVENMDFAPFEELLAATSEPFMDRADYRQYGIPATREQTVHATFCGT